ncbi:MAG: KamA family radical SAM protein [candidate division KSB1 bacterium]|nr:KamA family radical SAM protein [candidate division KSB1 bacterium]MDZ7318008.1 KamA family radical SAM protein [candidate division KSB1 bacterium]MDZ7341577.1 KamA family radical SAM protein [candidate division KSB1 bacterium]
METWQKILQKSLESAKEISERFDIPLADVEKIKQEFDIKINPYYLSLIKEKGDPIYKQVVPDLRELDNNGLFQDPLSEDRDSPVTNIVHRYPDRCLFLVSHQCASYCRFCTRKRKVGDPSKISLKFIDEGIEYIEKHPEIRDVILSGGDPLLLSDDRLKYILHKLRRIPHVEIIRIGTRVPCFLPQRITAKLAKMLRKFHPLYINVHFNHPTELTPIAVKALGRLADAGIPLGNQTVLLKGVNDDPAVMKKLVQKLLQARVRPYYIYQADYVVGTEHFRTRVEKGLEIIRALRGWTSGLAVPHFVIDSPGGGGKIPLLPEYVVQITDEEVVLRNYQGKIFRYRQTAEGNGKHHHAEDAPIILDDFAGETPCFQCDEAIA